jgi:hypothetical protein
MQTTAPYGYDEIVPLRKDHRVLLPEGATLVFASLDQSTSFAPVIVPGLEHGVNLFVGEGGEWDRSVYYPAFVRRYPFCISKLYVDGSAQSERVACVAKAQVDEADLDRTAQMCAALARFQLFDPFTMQSTEVNLSGMYRVSEAKLRDLKASSLKQLVDKGFMGPIYAHLHSLQNFTRLGDRRRGADTG